MIDTHTFIPDVLTVGVGEQITVVNRDEVPHTVTAWEGAFESGFINGRQSYTFSVDEPGQYMYRCDVHPRMIGQIVVTPSA